MPPNEFCMRADACSVGALMRATFHVKTAQICQGRIALYKEVFVQRTTFVPNIPTLFPVLPSPKEAQADQNQHQTLPYRAHNIRSVNSLSTTNVTCVVQFSSHTSVGHYPPPPPCISYANAHNYYGPYAYCSLDKGAACTQHIQLPTHMCAGRMC